MLKLLDDSDGLVEKAATGFALDHPGALAGDGEVLARRPERDEVAVGKVGAADLGDVAPPRDVGPVAGEDGLALLVPFDLRDCGHPGAL
jgi:hypothetical protein